MISSDYQMTFGYGRTDSPYGTAAYPYHRGDDWYMPDETPIVVNGVMIGLSGHSGFVTGSHCHIGKWVGNKDYDPESQGWELDDPVVIDVGNDDINGYWVKLRDAAGFVWVYLHMTPDTQAVSIGQRLSDLPKYNKGDNDMSNNDLADNYFVQACAEAILGRTAAGDQNLLNNVGQPKTSVLDTFRSYPEAKARVAKLDNYDALVKQVADLEAQLAQAGSGNATTLKPGLYNVPAPSK